MLFRSGDLITEGGDITLTSGSAINANGATYNAANGLIDKPLVDRYGHPIPIVAATASTVIDLATTGSVFILNHSTNITTLSITGNPGLVSGKQIGKPIVMIRRKDATGTPRTIGAWANVLWNYGVTPDLTQEESAIDVFTILPFFDGTNHLGFVGGTAMALPS